MPQKKPDSPDGIICRVCNRDLPPVHFFLFRGRHYNKAFWVNFPPKELQNHICFECAGPYVCIKCGQIKEASAFRIQGMMCSECRGARRIARIR